jgi:CheY-like chemotaxis protein
VTERRWQLGAGLGGLIALVLLLLVGQPIMQAPLGEEARARRELHALLDSTERGTLPVEALLQRIPEAGLLDAASIERDLRSGISPGTQARLRVSLQSAESAAEVRTQARLQWCGWLALAAVCGLALCLRGLWESGRVGAAQEHELPVQALRRRRQRIWIADDHSQSRKATARLLARAGFEVLGFESGTALLGRLRASAVAAPELIVLDLEMPGLHGNSAARMLRETGFSGALLAFTAHDGVAERLEALSCGFDDMVCKPIAGERFVALVQGLLEPGSEPDRERMATGRRRMQQALLASDVQDLDRLAEELAQWASESGLAGLERAAADVLGVLREGRASAGSLEQGREPLLQACERLDQQLQSLTR